ELEHPHGDDVLVVRAVEDADLAPRRKIRVDAPEVVVRELRRARRPERNDPATLRIDAFEHRADHAVLPGRVESLQDEEDASARLRVEAPLQLLEPAVQLLEHLLRLGLAFQAKGVAGVALGDLCRLPRLDADPPDHPITTLTRTGD